MRVGAGAACAPWEAGKVAGCETLVAGSFPPAMTAADVDEYTTGWSLIGAQVLANLKRPCWLMSPIQDRLLAAV